MTGPPPRADRIYLGWEYAELHPDPGPPPGRPALPGPEQLSPGWLAAQQREERRLSRPLWLGGGSGLGLAGLAAVLGLLGVLNAALTVAGLGCFMLLAVWCARGVWLGRRELAALVAQEQRRVARARAVRDQQWHGWQQEHDRRLRDWQARGRRYQDQPQWYGVALAADLDRVDVAGGTLAGWSALLTMLAGSPAGGRRRGHRARPGRGPGRPGPAAGRRQRRSRPTGLGAARRPAPVRPGPRAAGGGAGRCAGRGRGGGRRPSQPARPVRHGAGHGHPGAHRRAAR